MLPVPRPADGDAGPWPVVDHRDLTWGWLTSGQGCPIGQRHATFGIRGAVSVWLHAGRSGHQARSDFAGRGLVAVDPLGQVVQVRPVDDRIGRVDVPALDERHGRAGREWVNGPSSSSSTNRLPMYVSTLHPRSGWGRPASGSKRRTSTDPSRTYPTQPASLK